jgi:hypothetical protein
MFIHQILLSFLENEKAQEDQNFVQYCLNKSYDIIKLQLHVNRLHRSIYIRHRILLFAQGIL